MATKKHLIQSIFIPTLCYQCQTWSLTEKQKNKLVTTEMRCLRKVAGVTRRDRIKNNVTRERLSIEPILKYIQKQQIKWFAHLERMPRDSISYKAYIKRGKEERRARDRPRVRWIDNIIETLQEHKMTIIEAARKAKTRSLYLPRHPKGYKRKSRKRKKF
jgi:hypothetical protein